MDSRMLSEDTVRVAASFADKDEAIRACGDLLVKAGHVKPAYVDKMVERDRLSTTYVGSGVAVPHGTKDGIALVSSTGLAVIQVPSGVDFGRGNMAYLLVGIAAKGNEHMDLLTEIASICADDDRLAALLAAGSAAEIIALIGGGSGA
jgi:PTS system mannitol-specific IIA component